MEHISKQGTKFIFDGSLQPTILVKNHPFEADRFAADVAEFIGWHVVNIYPTLSSFIGYDGLIFSFEEMQRSPSLETILSKIKLASPREY